LQIWFICVIPKLFPPLSGRHRYFFFLFTLACASPSRKVVHPLCMMPQFFSPRHPHFPPTLPPKSASSGRTHKIFSPLRSHNGINPFPSLRLLQLVNSSGTVLAWAPPQTMGQPFFPPAKKNFSPISNICLFSFWTPSVPLFFPVPSFS